MKEVIPHGKYFEVQSTLEKRRALQPQSIECMFIGYPDESKGFKLLDIKTKKIIIESVDVIVTSECIHLYFLCIVIRCLFRDVFVMYLSHVMPRCSYREFL